MNLKSLFLGQLLYFGPESIENLDWEIYIPIHNTPNKLYVCQSEIIKKSLVFFLQYLTKMVIHKLYIIGEIRPFKSFWGTKVNLQMFRLVKVETSDFVPMEKCSPCHSCFCVIHISQEKMGAQEILKWVITIDKE